ncbi:hypothetical protein [Ruegeria sp. Ofav3-42]|uniref:hypothetical protein n=1 Tax=Ruegeria sp. Ofav3-42 TaxID=2917759 RepID=UPI001EF6B4E3|nr:hypothetical protein [Ruegeria sp. Ofav3-42]MCG7522747.1 hypothetical protein [Ruegeria sp. Ofav3-42]
MNKRKKRFWSDDEKREICQQASLPELIDVSAEPIFFPVEVGSEFPDTPAPMSGALEPALAPISSGRIEIELAGGHKISAEAGFDPDVLARLLKGIIH